MNGITESLGEIGQGVLAAQATEGGLASIRDGHTHETACLNCGTPLIGTHCHACGQAAHVHRSLGAFFHDLLHGVFHFEGRIWRTLPMLAWRPGKLTREYIDGRRARYVSPIALFLFSVFLMFAVFHALEGTEVAGAPALSNVDLDRAASDTRSELSRLRAERKILLDRRADTGAIDRRIESRERALEALTDTRSAISENMPRAARYSNFEKIDKAIRKFQKNPELAAYKLQTYAYKYSWALIPISVPFLWLLFPFSRRFHLYDHTVFVTYSLCFMTMLVIFGMVLERLGASVVMTLLFFLPPIHMFRQLRGAYGLGVFGALWRTAVLSWFSATALIIFFVMIMAQISL